MARQGRFELPEVRHHRISNPAQWPGYATAAVSLAKLDVVSQHDGQILTSLTRL